MTKTFKVAPSVALVALLGVAGCSSVPDYANPVEWYNSASDSVGGWFSDDEEEAGVASDPGTSANTEYPNLATVPGRPQPSTTEEEREAIREGLTADRANARYTDTAPSSAAVAPTGFAAPSAPAPTQSTTPATTPPAAAATAAVPQQAASSAPAASRSGGTQQSGLWPNRPAPDSQVRTGATSARVDSANAPLPTVPQGLRAPQQQTASAPTQPTRTLDSAGTGTARSAAQQSSAPAATATSRQAAAQASAASSAAVTTDLSALDAVGSGFPGSGPTGFIPSGPTYLAATVYFGHGSAGLTGQERAQIAQIAQQVAETGGFVTVIGHASSRTADMDLAQHDRVNFDISVRRAESVASAMIRAGMPADRVTAQGVADSQPAFYEIMPSGEAGNRRAEILVQY